MAVSNIEETSHVERRLKAQMIAIFKYFMGYHITKGFDFFLSVALKG